MESVLDERDEEIENNPNNIEHISEHEAKDNKTTPNKLEGFTILGTDNFNKKQEVKRVLPDWLQNPTIISVNLQKLEHKVSDCKLLDKSLRKQLKANGIKHFFPVQVEVIPWLLKSYHQSAILFPRDICVSAPTGSGKTLAFVLPIVQALQRHIVKKIRALVILPTQDLALQVFKTFRKYTVGSRLDVLMVTGNASFANEQKQLVAENVAFGYVSKVDILVCTAGKLVDHLKHTKGLDLSDLEFLVIDEADRVLDNVQNDWLYHLEEHILDKGGNPSVKYLNIKSLKKKRPPQKLLFSATLSQDPEKLQKLSLFQPKLFTSVVENDEDESTLQQTEGTFVGKYTTPKELTEKYIICSLNLKPLVLYKFIKAAKLKKILVFTNTVDDSHRLTILLKNLFSDKLTIEEISSNLQTKDRDPLLQKFTKGEINIIICTDSLARGMDFTGVECVVSYSAPKHLKTYIHRVGRTARAGNEGLAVTMLNEPQVTAFKKMLEHAHKSDLSELVIREDDLEALEDRYKDALEGLRLTIEREEGDQLEKMVKQKKMVVRKNKRRKIEKGDSVNSV